MSPSGCGGCQKKLRRVSYLLSVDIPRDCSRLLPLVQPFSAVIITSLLNSNSSEVTISLAQIAAVFNSVRTELQRREPPSLLYSNSSAEASCHSKANVQCVFTELRRRGPPSLVYSDSGGPCPNKAIFCYCIFCPFTIVPQFA